MERDPFLRWQQSQPSTETAGQSMAEAVVQFYEAPSTVELETNPVASKSVPVQHGHRLASFFAMIALGVFVSYFGGYNKGFDAAQPESGAVSVMRDNSEDQLAAMVNFAADMDEATALVEAEDTVLLGSIGWFTRTPASNTQSVTAPDYWVSISASGERGGNGVVKFIVTVNGNSRATGRAAITLDFGDGDNAMRFVSLGRSNNGKGITIPFSHKYTDQRSYDARVKLTAQGDTNPQNDSASVSISISREPGPVSSPTPTPSTTPEINQAIRDIATYVSKEREYLYRESSLNDGRFVKVWHTLLSDDRHVVIHAAFNGVPANCPRVDDVYELQTGGWYKMATFDHATKMATRYNNGLPFVTYNMQPGNTYTVDVDSVNSIFASGTGVCGVGDVADQDSVKLNTTTIVSEDSDWAPLVGTNRRPVKGTKIQYKTVDNNVTTIRTDFYYQHAQYGYVLLHSSMQRDGRNIWDRRLVAVND